MKSEEIEALIRRIYRKMLAEVNRARAEAFRECFVDALLFPARNLQILFRQER